ncbi:hypothetical protein [Cupriavidus necator]
MGKRAAAALYSTVMEFVYAVPPQSRQIALAEAATAVGLNNLEENIPTSRVAEACR